MRRRISTPPPSRLRGSRSLRISLIKSARKMRWTILAHLTSPGFACWRIQYQSRVTKQWLWVSMTSIILFSARAEGLKLGERETRCLARLGFQHLSNENIPLWCWYSDLPNSQFDEALFSSFIGASDDERVGALSVLSALAREISTNHKYITREGILNTWFSEKILSTSKVGGPRVSHEDGNSGGLRYCQKGI